MIGRRTLLAAALGLSAAACSPLRLLDGAARGERAARSAGIAYGPLPRQKLDVYVPDAAGSGRPVMVFFYGGSWRNGARASYRFAGEALASRGFVAVVPDYRTWPEVRFPAFVEDGAGALGWTKRSIAQHGGDPGKVFVIGHSAGAHIAALLALDPRYLARENLGPDALRGFIGMAGPYDFLPIRSRTLQQIFGGADGIPETQPVNFASAAAPPALLLHGTDDTTVLPRNSERLAARLQEAGARARLGLYPGVGHVRILTALARGLQQGVPVLDDLTEFARALA